MASRRIVSIVVCLFALVSSASTNRAEATEGRGQWILVTPPGLKATAKPLIARRQQQGWKCAVIDTTGESTAEELRTKLIQHATAFEGTTTILLLGAWLGDKQSITPAANGTHGRMKKLLTDHWLGQPKPDGSLTVAVGRLPARSVEEAQLMIAKLLKFEATVPQTNSVNLIVAHPGGGTPLEKTIAENVIRSAVNLRLGQLDSSWQPECIMDVPNSTYTVATAKFGAEIKRMLEQPYVFAVYSGHSNASGMYSVGGNVFGRSQFKKLTPNRKTDQAAGVLVSCGCYGCQLSGYPPGQGYGLYAIRSIDGPAAVIGAFGESYSAMGLLALDGLLAQTKSPAKTQTLGEYWLSIQHGITQGEIAPGEFLMHDMADGSRGKVSLKDQRLEHAEMWTLLGDPAMQIPVKLDDTK